MGCVSSSKVPLLTSQNLIFKIHWTNPLEKSDSFSSIVFLKGASLLRVDVLQPFIGSVGSFILNKEEMILYLPLKKTYYKGAFDSKVFFPNFPSFSAEKLISLLRAKAPQGWKCKKRQDKLTQCQNPLFKVSWKYNKSHLNKINFKATQNRQITAHIKSLTSKNIPLKTFKPSLKEFQKQKDPLFFQEL